MSLGSLVLGGWQFFLVGIVILIGTSVRLLAKHDEPDMFLAREPFQNLLTYQLMLIMAIALIFVGAMTAAVR